MIDRINMLQKLIDENQLQTILSQMTSRHPIAYSYKRNGKQYIKQLLPNWKYKLDVNNYSITSFNLFTLIAD